MSNSSCGTNTLATMLGTCYKHIGVLIVMKHTLLISLSCERLSELGFRFSTTGSGNWTAPDAVLDSG